MDNPQTYCDVVKHRDSADVNRVYHDTAYGFPISDDNELFGRLLLEINQAGLSWTLILNKQENFRQAYSQFDIEAVAGYDEADRHRLLNDAGIIRNRLKINAAIYNAQRLQEIRANYGSFKAWLDHHTPRKKDDWVRLFKKTFKFTGGEITNEFLLSTGYLPGAHEPACPIYNKVITLNPPWLAHREFYGIKR